MTRFTLNLPETSIAGIKGAEAEKFDEYRDKRSKAVPKCHVWTPAGDLLVGCTDGQILKVFKVLKEMLHISFGQGSLLQNL